MLTRTDDKNSAKAYDDVPLNAELSGSRMDRLVRPRTRWARLIGVSSLVLVAAVILVHVVRQYADPTIRRGDISAAMVESKLFAELAVARAVAEPSNTIVVDAVESGRVEAVEVANGQDVKKSQILVRLSNPQRQQDVLARQSEVAQQLGNLVTLRVNNEVSQAAHDRQVADIEFQVAQTEKQLLRERALMSSGFVSGAKAEETLDLLAKQVRTLAQANLAKEQELRARTEAISQMTASLSTMQQGLRMLREGIDALQVRAPADGRLTDFQRKIGETVKVGDRIGVIEGHGPPKLIAKIDEFYLSRVSVNTKGTAKAGDGVTHTISTIAVNPQVRDGTFTVELRFDNEPRQITRGQSFEVQLSLGDPRLALVIPDGPFMQDSGGQHVWVVDTDGTTITRRPVRLGRRSGSLIEVESGLRAGEHIVTSTYSAWANAQKLRLAD